MTTIERLGIQGVRSFGPESLETISFGTPLTVIVGHNGAGKTTLVECLKYALTDSPEVKAQIRVSLRQESQKKQMFIVRSMQLTHTLDKQRRLKPQFKALEAVLQIKDEEGQTASISHKCTNIDEQLSALLGISKPVLEHVILCHQEESCWPMGDMQSLKKKFDSLFDATRYVKALEAIRATKKRHLLDLKDRENDLRLLDAHREASKNLRRQLQQQQQAIAATSDEIKQLQTEVEALEAAVATGGELMRRVQQQQQQLVVAEEMQLLQQQKSEQLQQQLQQHQEGEGYPVVFEEPLEELEELLGRISAEYKAKGERRQAVCDKVNELQQQQHEVQQQLQQELAKAAEGLKAEERKDAAMQQQQQLLAKAAAKLPYPQQQRLTPESASGLCTAEAQKLRRKLQAAARELQALQQRQQQQLQQLQQKEQQQQAAVSASTSLLTHLQEQLQQLQQKLQQSQSKQQLQQSSAALKKQLQQLQQEGEAGGGEHQLTDLDTRIAYCGVSLLQLQRQRQQVQEAQQALQQHEALRVSLQVAQQLHQEKQEQQQQKQQLLQERLAALAAHTPEAFSCEPEAAEKQLAAAAAAAADEQQRKTHQQQAAAAALDRSAAKLHLLQQQLAAAAASCLRLAGQVDVAKSLLPVKRSSSSSSDNLGEWEAIAAWEVSGVAAAADAQLKRQQEEEEQLRQKVCEGGGEQRWFKGLAAEAAATGSCPLCSRSLEGSRGLAQLQQHVEHRLQALPETQDAAQQQLLLMQQLLQRMQQQQQAAQQLISSHRDLQALLATLKQHVQENDDLQLAAAAAATATATEKARTLEAAHAEALGVCAAAAAAAAARREVESVKEKLRSAAGVAGDSCSSSSSLQQQLQQLDSQISQLFAEREAAQRQQEQFRRQQLQRQQQQLQRQQQQLQLEAQLAQQGRVLQQLTEDEQQQENCRRQYEATDAALPGQQQLLHATRQQLQQLQQHHREAEQQAESQQRQLEASASELEAIAASLELQQQRVKEADAAVAAAAESATGVRLEQLRRQQQQTAAALHQEQQQQEQLNAAFDKGQLLLQEVRDSIEMKRQQQQQQQQALLVERLRAQLQETLQQGVNELQQQLSSRVTKEQHLTAAEVEALVEELRSEAAKRGQDLAELRGSLATREERRQQLLFELDNATYRQIDVRYLEALADCEAERLAVQDIDKYHKALDRALMGYHAAKMEAINTALKELWQTVYSGTDIDTIAIRSSVATADEASQHVGFASAASVAAGDRSYNYRVVMRSANGKELDMRGRCSAGQKVLASLVIRLALAECFCVNCQLLALDEPTTNLDTYNCESLARALGRLVKARQGSRAFQLLLITHDESFVYKLGREGLCDTYLKVRKDSNGRSRLSSATLHV